jgi:hypothetical protein
MNLLGHKFKIGDLIATHDAFNNNKLIIGLIKQCYIGVKNLPLYVIIWADNDNKANAGHSLSECSIEVSMPERSVEVYRDIYLRFRREMDHGKR